MGAFLQAPLPPGELVVVRHPASWVRLGLDDVDELWAVHVALYGIRVSTRLWGLERDAKLQKMTWTAGGQKFHLQQKVTLVT